MFLKPLFAFFALLLVDGITTTAIRRTTGVSALSLHDNHINAGFFCSRRTLVRQGIGISSSLIVGSNNLVATAASSTSPRSSVEVSGPGPPASPPLPIPYRPEYEGNPTLSSSIIPLQTKLGRDRILALELRPLATQLTPFATDNELYYPPFLFGSWKVQAKLRRKVYPYGKAFVPSLSLVEGSPRNRYEQVDDDLPPTSYEVHYYSTLADTVQNQVTVQLGRGIPKSKIIADRAYNARSISKAYNQRMPVQDVDWNPSLDPTRMTLNYGINQRVADDMKPLGPQRTEVYFTARQSETMALEPLEVNQQQHKQLQLQLHDDSSSMSQQPRQVFCSAERSRLVTLATGTVIVSDTESITEFQTATDDGNQVQAWQRVAVYLTPNPNSREGILWQQVGGKAVAFYDYELHMERILGRRLPPSNRSATTAVACVQTPKDFVQCEEVVNVVGPTE